MITREVYDVTMCIRHCYTLLRIFMHVVTKNIYACFVYACLFIYCSDADNM